jgi:pimeloyl-ACP methyl ester carboxylesterase
MGTQKVRSPDGTAIAYERSGSGPVVILVDGALCSRAFGPSAALAKRLAERFTVIAYDRRGRNESGDTAPYAPSREVEDIAALIEAAGGSATLVGLSSGAALALQAAASGLPVRKVVAYEPPYVYEGTDIRRDHVAALQGLVGEGRRGAAVAYFMHDMVGLPRFMTWMMRLMFWMWRKLEAVAHTLAYDAAVMGDFHVPAERLRGIQVPALVMYGGKTDEKLKRATVAAADAIPGSRLAVLEGQTHNVSADVLAPAVVAFVEEA